MNGRFDPLAWVRPEIRRLKAYAVPDREGFTLLDAMENPYSWPADLESAWLSRLKGMSLNRYPDPQAVALKSRIRQVMGVPKDCKLLLGNGSDELIQLMAMAVAGEGRYVLAPEPSFVMYQMISVYTGMSYAGVPLNQDFSLDLAAMREQIEVLNPALIFLAYPNNPTGNCWSREDIETIIELAPGWVVVDEAYAPFAQKSMMDSLSRYRNLLVMRTLSKVGLAGLRLGYMAGAADVIAEIDKLRLPYNINSMTQVSADFALENIEVFDAQADEIRERRGRLIESLNGMDGITAYPSEANFVLFRTPEGQTGRLFSSLLSAGVLIKNLSAPGLLADCLRVTVGSEADQQKFLTALKQAL